MDVGLFRLEHSLSVTGTVLITGTPELEGGSPVKAYRGETERIAETMRRTHRD